MLAGAIPLEGGASQENTCDQAMNAQSEQEGSF